MTNKPNKPVKLHTQSEEAQRQNVLRTIAMKRESYFTLILGNLLRNESVMAERYAETPDGKVTTRIVGIKEVIDTALEGSAYIINKMYTAQPEGEEKKEGE